MLYESLIGHDAFYQSSWFCDCLNWIWMETINNPQSVFTLTAMILQIEVKRKSRYIVNVKNSYERPPAQTISSKQAALRVHVDSQNFTSKGFFANEIIQKNLLEKSSRWSKKSSQSMFSPPNFIQLESTIFLIFCRIQCTIGNISLHHSYESPSHLIFCFSVWFST